jgi:hypothetical protein
VAWRGVRCKETCRSLFLHRNSDISKVRIRDIPIVMSLLVSYYYNYENVISNKWRYKEMSVIVSLFTQPWYVWWAMIISVFAVKVGFIWLAVRN